MNFFILHKYNKPTANKLLEINNSLEFSFSDKENRKGTTNYLTKTSKNVRTWFSIFWAIRAIKAIVSNLNK